MDIICLIFAGYNLKKDVAEFLDAYEIRGY